MLVQQLLHRGERACDVSDAVVWHRTSANRATAHYIRVRFKAHAVAEPRSSKLTRRRAVCGIPLQPIAWRIRDFVRCVFSVPVRIHKRLRLETKLMTHWGVLTESTPQARENESWCQGRELNPRPRAYESPALPLSYPGTLSLVCEIHAEKQADKTSPIGWGSVCQYSVAAESGSLFVPKRFSPNRAPSCLAAPPYD